MSNPVKNLFDVLLAVGIGTRGERETVLERTAHGSAQASNGGCSISLDVA